MRKIANKPFKPTIEVNNWELDEHRGQTKVRGYVGPHRFKSGPLVYINLGGGIVETQTTRIKLKGERADAARLEEHQEG